MGVLICVFFCPCITLHSIRVRARVCGQGAQWRAESAHGLSHFQALLSRCKSTVTNAGGRWLSQSRSLLTFSSILLTQVTSVFPRSAARAREVASSPHGLIETTFWPRQIKLFSSSVHLFSCSFVPRPRTASLSLRAKNLSS